MSKIYSFLIVISFSSWAYALEMEHPFMCKVMREKGYENQSNSHQPQQHQLTQSALDARQFSKEQETKQRLAAYARVKEKIEQHGCAKDDAVKQLVKTTCLLKKMPEDMQEHVLGNIQEMMCEHEMQPRQKAITFCSLAPQGKYLLTLSKDKKAQIWHVATGSCFTLPGDKEILQENENGSQKYVELLDGDRKLSAQLENIYPPAHPVSLGQDQITEGDRQLLAIDKELKRLTYAYEVIFKRSCPEAENYIHCIRWSPNGSRLAYSNVKGGIDIWDVELGSCQHIALGYYPDKNCLAWSSDGKKLAACELNMLRILNAEAGESEHSLKQNEDRENKFVAVCWAPDDKKLVVLRKKSMEIVNIESGVCERIIDVENRHAGLAEHISWSANGKQLAVIACDKNIHIWDVHTGDYVRRLLGDSCCWAPKNLGMGKILAIMNKNHTYAVVHDPAPHSILPMVGAVQGLKWEPHGAKVALYSGKTVRIWEHFMCLYKDYVHEGNGDIIDITWSPDGKKLTSCCADGSVMVWADTAEVFRKVIQQPAPEAVLTCAGAFAYWLKKK